MHFKHNTLYFEEKTSSTTQTGVMPGNVCVWPDRFMEEAWEGRMIFFDPISRGLSVVQDTPPGDALVISYTQSEVSDSTAAAAQLADAASAASFMQDQWRAAAENMRDMGNVVSAYS